MIQQEQRQEEVAEDLKQEMPAKEVKNGVELSNPLEIVQRMLEVATEELDLLQ